jgi:hypothetical protein
MTTTFQKRQKEFKRQEKQKAKAEKRKNKANVKRDPDQQGPPIGSVDPQDLGITDADGHDFENPA